MNKEILQANIKNMFIIILITALSCLAVFVASKILIDQVYTPDTYPEIWLSAFSVNIYMEVAILIVIGMAFYILQGFIMKTNELTSLLKFAHFVITLLVAFYFVYFINKNMGLEKGSTYIYIFALIPWVLLNFSISLFPPETARTKFIMYNMFRNR